MVVNGAAYAPMAHTARLSGYAPNRVVRSVRRDWRIRPLALAYVLSAVPGGCAHTARLLKILIQVFE